MAPRLSIIVSTFDRPDALSLCLDGVRYAAESVPDIEVVVADDGSGPSTAAAIRRFAAEVSFPVAHARHEHDGFRLAAARNLAVRKARGDVLVFLDGDCVLFPDALARHASRCLPGQAHTGARVFLTEEETARVLAARASPKVLLRPAWRRERGRLRRLRMQDILYGFFRLKPRPKLVAANCAIHRGDFERVNGFDERFVGWGYEDDDLIRRLRRPGVKLAAGTLDCLCLHLFHKVHESHRPTVREAANYRYFHRAHVLTRCRRGLAPRPLEAVRCEVLGAPPAFLRPLLDRLEYSRTVDGPPEVSLLFSGWRRGPRPRGEATVEVEEKILAAGPEAVLAFLDAIV